VAVVAAAIAVAAEALVAIVARCPVKLVVPIQAPKVFFRPSLALATRLPLELVAQVVIKETEQREVIRYFRQLHQPEEAAALPTEVPLAMEEVEAVELDLRLQIAVVPERGIKVRMAAMDATTRPIARAVVAAVHQPMVLLRLLPLLMAAPGCHHQ
jgi:hypothetical protein